MAVQVVDIKPASDRVQHIGRAIEVGAVGELYGKRSVPGCCEPLTGNP